MNERSEGSAPAMTKCDRAPRRAVKDQVLTTALQQEPLAQALIGLKARSPLRGPQV